MSVRMDRWMNMVKDGWMSVRMDRWMNMVKDGWMSVRMDRDGYGKGWLDECKDG